MAAFEFWNPTDDDRIRGFSHGGGVPGPAREQYHLTVWQWKIWNDAILSLCMSERAEFGEVRPAFRFDPGTKLLQENLPIPQDPAV